MHFNFSYSQITFYTVILMSDNHYYTLKKAGWRAQNTLLGQGRQPGQPTRLAQRHHLAEIFGTKPNLPQFTFLRLQQKNDFHNKYSGKTFYSCTICTILSYKINKNINCQKLKSIVPYLTNWMSSNAEQTLIDSTHISNTKTNN